MGLDGCQSIGMPKSSLERSSKLEFSDSEFVFWGVKFNGGIDMGEGGRERDGDLGEMVIWGVERGIWGVVERGSGDLGGGDCDVEGCGEGDLGGIGIFAYFPKQGELWERVEGKLVLQGNPHVVERGIQEVGIFAYFAKQGEFWERVEGELVLQGNPHVVVCPCFLLIFKNSPIRG